MCILHECMKDFKMYITVLLRSLPISVQGNSKDCLTALRKNRGISPICFVCTCV